MVHLFSPLANVYECSQHLSKYIPHSPQKCICTRACAHMQRYRSFFAMEAIANLSWVLREHRAGCRLPPALAAPPALSTNPSPDAVRSRNLSKSTLAHDVVAAAVSHKHHSIICVGAGLIQFVDGPHLCLAMELIHQRILILPWLSRAFSSLNLIFLGCICVCTRGRPLLLTKRLPPHQAFNQASVLLATPPRVR